jgi:hypothetical protein
MFVGRPKKAAVGVRKIEVVLQPWAGYAIVIAT